MKVLFLDIDGVLNGHQQQESGCCGLRPENVTNFNRVLRGVPDLKIVIISAWRYLLKEMSLKGFEHLLRIGGVACQGRLIGATVSDEEITSRGKQVERYLMDRHGRIEKFLIVDDMPFDYNPCGFTPLYTDPAAGMTEADAAKIITHFQG